MSAKLDQNDVIKRLSSNYEGAVSEYELLVLILRGDSRADVEPLAHGLIKSFGGIRNIMGADLDKLCAVKGMTRKRVIRLRITYFAALRFANPQGRFDQKGHLLPKH